MMGNIVSRYKRNNQELPEFPKNLADFGYAFNEQGELRNTETNGRFEFNVVDGDRRFNQAHYEALGDAIGFWVESELETRFGLVKRVIPEEGDRHDTDDHRGESGPTATSRIYMSPDALTNPSALLLLIQGSGVVRPGQWARSVIINDSLELGSMFPYIRRAKELGWSVIVFNPNENEGKLPTTHESAGPFDYDTTTGGSRKRVKRPRYVFVPGSESPEEHCMYVWKKFVSQAQAKHILMAAHSYGGYSTATLATSIPNFTERVRAIALTDSVHSAGSVSDTQGMGIEQWFSENAINWIKSNKPLGAHEPSAEQYFGCTCISAGHPKHEYTSGRAFASVFNFLETRLAKAMEQAEKDVGAGTLEGERALKGKGSSFGKVERNDKKEKKFVETEKKFVETEEKAFVETEGKEFVETEGKEFVETEGKEFVETERKEFVETEGKEFVETEGKALEEEGKPHEEDEKMSVEKEEEGKTQEEEGKPYEKDEKMQVEEDGKMQVEEDGKTLEEERKKTQEEEEKTQVEVEDEKTQVEEAENRKT